MKKKLIAVVLMFVLCLSATGCGSTSNEEVLGTEDGYYITFATEDDIESVYFDDNELVIIGIVGFDADEEEALNNLFDKEENGEEYKEYRFVLTDQSVFENIAEDVIESSQEEFEEWITSEYLYNGLEIIVCVEDGTVTYVARAS